MKQPDPDTDLTSDPVPLVNVTRDPPQSPAQHKFGDYPVPTALIADDVFYWDDDQIAALNYDAFGKCLAKTGDLYRESVYGGGLLFVSAEPNIPTRTVRKAHDLAPLIADRVRVRVVKGGKSHGSRIPASHLTDMCASEVFLRHFKPLDAVISEPMYFADYSLPQHGYNDKGFGCRIVYRGEPPIVSESTERLSAFLDQMDFATPADRANTIAAALTVLLRNFFCGAKPAIVVTADKSHAGKDTIVAFAAGCQRVSAISHQATDWPVERSFVGVLNAHPETAIVLVDNVRITGRSPFIASAFLERYLTDPEPVLFATGTGPPKRRKNDVLVAFTTNSGTLSEDLMNRALPIHLAPVGNVTDRISKIGNPKHEYLPAHNKQIVAELRGMIARWKAAGMPFDKSVRHPCSQWTATIGGILAVNGVSGFLNNYATRKTADDPTRQGIALLGAARPDIWLRPGVWAQIAADLGLTGRLIAPADRETETSRERGMGVVLSAHKMETFRIVTDDEILVLCLEWARRRFDSAKPEVRYRLRVLERSQIPECNHADDDARLAASS